MEYLNYKKQYIIVLLGISDASAKFIAFDLGCQGSQSDGGIFKNSSLAQICDSPNIPPATILGSLEPIPFFLIGDEAFSLATHMMKHMLTAQQ